MLPVCAVALCEVLSQYGPAVHIPWCSPVRLISFAPFLDSSEGVMHSRALFLIAILVAAFMLRERSGGPSRGGPTCHRTHARDRPISDRCRPGDSSVG